MEIREQCFTAPSVQIHNEANILSPFINYKYLHFARVSKHCKALCNPFTPDWTWFGDTSTVVFPIQISCPECWECNDPEENSNFILFTQH